MLIIGVMLAIRFQPIPEKEVRETRDMWEIRLQLQNEQHKQQELHAELNELKSIQSQYESASEYEQIRALNDSIETLKEKAGLTQINEPGILIEIFPEEVTEKDAEQIEEMVTLELTAELLHRLINELNSYGATHIAINNERMTNMTAIRPVGDHIHMNQRPLAANPLIVKVTSSDPDRLLSYMEVSQSRNEFNMHNIQFELKRTRDVNIPAYSDDINLEHVKIIEEDEAGGN